MYKKTANQSTNQLSIYYKFQKLQFVWAPPLFTESEYCSLFKKERGTFQFHAIIIPTLILHEYVLLLFD